MLEKYVECANNVTTFSGCGRILKADACDYINKTCLTMFYCLVLILVKYVTRHAYTMCTGRALQQVDSCVAIVVVDV